MQPNDLLVINDVLVEISYKGQHVLKNDVPVFRKDDFVTVNVYPSVVRFEV